MKKSLFIFGLIGLIYACGSESDEKKIERKNSKKESAEIDHRQTGKDVTNVAGATILKHLGKAMRIGGPNAAIQYCNINAMTITDSLSQAHNVSIKRIAERNRNPVNILEESDLGVWDYYKTGELNVLMSDTVISSNEKFVYYRPIYIANPACLNCHGQSGTDILEGTVAKINEFYPNDSAKNFVLGELRGMWKVEFN